MTKNRSSKPARASAAHPTRKASTPKPPVVDTKPAIDEAALAKKAARAAAIATELARLTAGIPPLDSPEGRAQLGKRIRSESDHLQRAFNGLPREERRRLEFRTRLGTLQAATHCFDQDEPPLGIGIVNPIPITTWHDFAAALAGMIVETREAFGCEPLPIVAEAPPQPRAWPPILVHEMTDGRRRRDLRKGTAALETFVEGLEQDLASVLALLDLAREAKDEPEIMARDRNFEICDRAFEVLRKFAHGDEDANAGDARVALEAVAAVRVYVSGGALFDAPYPIDVDSAERYIAEYGLAEGSAPLHALAFSAT